MNIEDVILIWNSQADEFNQWDSLGMDEKFDFLLILLKGDHEQMANVASTEGLGAVAGARIHCLKTWPEFFREVKAGNKPFEVRRNDRGFRDGT